MKYILRTYNKLLGREGVIGTTEIKIRVRNIGEIEIVQLRIAQVHRPLTRKRPGSSVTRCRFIHICLGDVAVVPHLNTAVGIQIE